MITLVFLDRYLTSPEYRASLTDDDRCRAEAVMSAPGVRDWLMPQLPDRQAVA